MVFNHVRRSNYFQRLNALFKSHPIQYRRVINMGGRNTAFYAFFIMIRNLVTAMLIATAPISINNTQTTANRTVTNQVYYEQTGEYLTNATYGKRYLYTPNSSLYNYNLIEYQENGYVQMVGSVVNNTLIIVIDLLNVQKIKANVNATPYDEIYTRMNKAWNLPYNNDYLYDAIFYQAILENGYESATDYLINEFITQRTLEQWTNQLTQNIANNIYNAVTVSTGLKNEYSKTGTDAIQILTDPTLRAQTHYFNIEDGQIQYSVDFQRMVYHFTNDASIPLPTSMGYLNPIEIELIWTIPENPQQNQIVDIPGLLLEILGMPFAFISQAFNLTIFPNTPYAVNLSHIFLALICAGIMIFIIKKVIK